MNKGDEPRIPIGTIMHFFDIDSLILDTDIPIKTTDLGGVIDNGKGWYICNGQTTTDLLSNKQTPNLIGENHFLRGSLEQGIVTEEGGEETHVITEAEMPAHYHRVTIWFNPDSHGADLHGGNYNHIVHDNLSYVDGGSAGSNQTHENLPPFQNCMFIIKLSE